MKKLKIKLSIFLLLASVVVTPTLSLASEIEGLIENNNQETVVEDNTEAQEEGNATDSEVVTTPPTEPETEVPTENTDETNTSDTGTVPTEPVPSEPVPSEPKPTEPKPTEPTEPNKPGNKPAPSDPNITEEPNKGSSNNGKPNNNTGGNKPNTNNNRPAASSSNQGQTSPQAGQISSGDIITVTPNQTSQEFIDEIGPLAEEVAEENGLYASVMIAQAALESAFGKSSLASAPNYNLFGIKGTYENTAVNLPTLEDAGNGSMYQIFANFRKYPSYKESLEDYANLIKKGIAGNPTFYNGVWKKNAKTYEVATKFLTGKYATDTSYDKKLNAIIQAYDLTQYDEGTYTKDRVYKVKANDTLNEITQKEKVKLKTILKLNKDIEDPNLIEIDQKIILEKGKKVKRKSNGKGNTSIVSYAREYFGVPYVWGGTTPAGFDCSGFVQYIYAKAGKTMPRVTTQQEHVGTEIAISNAVPGDLLFWGAKGETYHVAVYSGNGNMIMAPQPGDVVKEMPVASFMPDFAMHTV